MRGLTRIVALLTGFLAQGCAGPTFQEASDQIPALTPGMGRIYFYRPGAFVGAAIRPAVNLNGEKVGKWAPGGFFFVDRRPGNYEVISSTEAEYRVIFTLASGETRYVRAHMSMGFFVGHVIPNLVGSEEALKEIQDCHYGGYLGESLLNPATPP